jgi:prepilin peptidase CpaA
VALGISSDTVIVSLFCAPLLVAGACDLISYRIPNLVTAAVAVFFVVCALVWGVQVDWLAHGGAGLLVLAVGIALFACKVFGGGDIKLLAAVSLWIGWSQDLVVFLLLAAILGGVIALALVLVRYALSMWAGPWQVRLPKLFQPSAPVPYGIAIVAAALWAAPHVPQFLFFR